MSIYTPEQQKRWGRYIVGGFAFVIGLLLLARITNESALAVYFLITAGIYVDWVRLRWVNEHDYRKCSCDQCKREQKNQ